jgi:cytidyltransferase-like protein
LNKVLCLGGFDILHWGHIQFLRQAETFGEVTVGLSTDEFLAETKRTPVFTFLERRQVLQRFGYEVVVRDATDTRDLFRKVKPTVFVCGNDWVGNNHLVSAGLNIDFLNAMNVTLVYTPRDHQMSTTEILLRARRSM